MSATHTPGPWFTFANGHCVGGRRFDSETSPTAGIAMCSMSARDAEENQANARLIAAAPELLKVAQDFAESLSELGMLCECGENDCRTTRLRAAIAKATGATP